MTGALLMVIVLHYTLPHCECIWEGSLEEGHLAQGGCAFVILVDSGVVVSRGVNTPTSDV